MILGFTCGTYDLFHTGHVFALKEAKLNCDYLIVGLQTDPTIDRKEKNKPIQTIQERLVQVDACKYVDEVWLYSTETELYQYLLENLKKIDRRFLGEDWSGKTYTGHDLGMQVQFTERRHSYSSTELKQRILNSLGKV